MRVLVIAMLMPLLSRTHRWGHEHFAVTALGAVLWLRTDIGATSWGRLWDVSWILFSKMEKTCPSPSVPWFKHLHATS